MNDFPLRVLTAERVFFDGACRSLTVPGTDGEYGILAGHSPAVIALAPGVMTLCLPEGETRRAAIAGGILRVRNGEALVLTDTAEAPEELDLRRAERAEAAAREALRRSRSAREYAALERDLSRALSREKAVRSFGSL